MLEPIFDLPQPVLGLRARGRLERDDCRNMLEPHLDRVSGDGRRLRLFCELGPDFEGVTAGGLLDELRVAGKCLSALDRCAVVTDSEAGRAAAQTLAPVLPFRARAFPLSQRDEALRWLNTMPQQHGLSLRYRPELRVLFVQHVGPITTEDFEALEEVADAFGESGRWPQGIVVQSRGLPEWDRPGTLLRHLRLLRASAGRVERIALAVDGPVANVVGLIADHLVMPEVKRFAYDAVWDAAEWAGDASASLRHDSGPRRRPLDPVHEAGIESFPASDPPAY